MVILDLKKSYTFFEVEVEFGSPESHSIRKFVRSKLTEYEYDYRRKYWKRIGNFIMANDVTNTIRFPRPYLESFINNMNSVGIDFNISEYPHHYEPTEIDTFLRPEAIPREEQNEAIEFLLDSPMNRKGLTLAPGVGKTFISIYVIAKMQKVGMIVVSGLIDQWVESIDKFTLEKEDVYVIKGFNSLKKLLESTYQPKFIVCSLETLRPYVYNVGAYRHMLPYEEFLEKYNVGVKVIDEAHLNFKTGVKIDLKSIVPQNLYLTATFTKAGPIKRIFNTIYPDEIKYGDSDNKHSNITFYAYNSRVPEKVCKTRRGYMHIRFEKHMLERATKIASFVNNVLIPIINMHYISKKKPGQKCLIFFSLKAMINEIKGYLKLYYPELNILPYTAEDPDDNLKDGVDIILSTHKSCGVGTDIKNLKTCINTVSMASESLVIQMLGRLRKLKDDTPEFVDIYDPGIESHYRHYMTRSGLYKGRCTQYSETSF